MARQRLPRALVSRREQYLRSRTGDLTSYAALIGESVRAKIDLLAQLIRDAHHPSLGTYKERLLLDAIRQFIPRRYEAGTGFVVFPTERRFKGPIPKAYDVLNSADHVVSGQCDIIVYDSTEFPVLLRDGDFVVVRPEAVRAVIEVKGSLDSRDIDRTVHHFIDFGHKWKACRAFYKAHHERHKLASPGLFMMAWQVSVDTRGRPRTDAGRLRRRIATLYKNGVSKHELTHFPILSSAYIHGDAEISSSYWLEGDRSDFGFATHGGRFIRFSDDGEPHEAGDETVASLLARIHSRLDTPFNRFLSYAHQTRSTNLFPHKHRGFSCWLEGDDVKLLGPPER